MPNSLLNFLFHLFFVNSFHCKKENETKKYHFYTIAGCDGIIKI